MFIITIIIIIIIIFIIIIIIIIIIKIFIIIIIIIIIINGEARTLKVMHIKGRLLDQAVILFNCVPFHNGNFSDRKEFAPRGCEFFPLRAVPCHSKLDDSSVQLHWSIGHDLYPVIPSWIPSGLVHYIWHGPLYNLRGHRL